MIQVFPLVTLVGLVQKLIAKNTGLKCYDMIPLNAAVPYHFIDVQSVSPEDTKTMFVHEYLLSVHTITEGGKHADMYKRLSTLAEALTEEIALPEGYTLIMQQNEGVTSIYTEQDGYLHAISPLRIRIAYGFKVKV